MSSARHNARELAQRLEHSGAHHLLTEIHHLVHVRIGPVKLQHRELGIVSAVDAFVAEVAIEFVDLFKAANQQSLQVKLRRDARIERRCRARCGGS